MNNDRMSPLLLALIERLKDLFPEGQRRELDPNYQPPVDPNSWGGQFMHPLNRGNNGLRIQDLLNRGNRNTWGE